MNEYLVTEQFEQRICEYTGAPFCLTFDNNSNAMFSTLYYEDIRHKEVTIPKHTYMSVPSVIKLNGGKVRFKDSPKKVKGWYRLEGTRTIDSALTFTNDMYVPGSFMVLSFTGPYKHLKLGKGGAVLLDDEKAYNWLKKFRYNGRNEMSYHEDTFDMVGMNFYMHPTTAALGLQLMRQFWYEGKPISNPDLELEYPDLSDPKHTAYKD